MGVVHYDRIQVRLQFMADYGEVVRLIDDDERDGVDGRNSDKCSDRVSSYSGEGRNGAVITITSKSGRGGHPSI